MVRTPLTDIVPRIEFAWWETALMRAGFALLLLARFPPLTTLPALGADLRFPNGLARWIDMSWVLDPTGYSLLVILLHIASVLYITGFAFPLSSTTLFLCYLFTGTLHNSLGSISHYYQVMTLILLGQSVAAWLWAFTERRPATWMRSPTSLHSFTTRVTLQVLAGNYVLCAITKLINSNGAWIWNSQYMPVQYAKIQAQHYYTTLEHPDLGLGGALNELCTQYPWLCMLVYAPGLIVELFAFLMLFGRVWMLVTGLAVVAMHALVDVTMNLGFPQHQWIFIVYAVNLPFWAAKAIQSLPSGRQRLPASEMRRNNTGS
jgi:hypothetical protein